MGFSNERMRTGQLVNWFLLEGLELTPAGNPVTMHMAFEAAANKARVCFIGTPHKDMSFTPAQ